MFAREATPSARKNARLGLETLEDRRVMAISSLAGSVVRMPADNAGGTPATAQVVSLDLMESASASDHLPSASDVDVYKVSLQHGDYLAADVDSTGTTSLNGTLAILNSQAVQLAFNRYGTEPESGAYRAEPSLGFYAPADGDYFVQVKTTASTTNTGRSYQLNLQRIGVEDEGQSAEDLAQDGRFHTWLNASGTSLSIAGPTGYGMSLDGAWSKSVSGQTVKYSVNGPVTLRTTYLNGAVGGLALSTGSDGFTVEATAAGWHQLGELKSTSGGLGLPLGLLTQDLNEVLGIDLDEVAVAAKWTIMTGEEVRANFPQHEIAQVLDGVPYLVYGETGSLKAQVGTIQVTTGDASELILIADPADPFLYAGYDDYAIAGSLAGRIPFNTTLGQLQPSYSVEGGTDQFLRQAADAYFGHLYLSGEVPLAGFKAPVVGDLAFTGEAGLTINLDANGDGAFLGGAGTAEELQSGNLSAFETAIQDVNFAVNGEVNVGFDVAGYDVQIPLGTASVYYSGPQQAIFFDGIQGMGADAWEGTPLEDFRSDAEIRVKGYAYRDGRFSVTSSSRYYLLGNYADLGITVRSEGTVASTEIVAAGTLHTWIGDAYVSGTIGLDGDYTLAASVSLDIGDDNNYIRGQATGTLQKNGSTTSLTIDGEFDCQLKISGVAKAKGKASGSLTITRHANGSVSYSTTFGFSGELYAWNPVKYITHGGWNKVDDVEGGFEISNDTLEVNLDGNRFSLSLP